jgi:hypothetical protein
MFVTCVPSTYFIVATHIIVALRVIRIRSCYYSVGHSASGFFVITVLGRVAVGLMKVGSSLTVWRRGVGCRVDNPWSVHGSERVFTCGVF